MKMFRRQGYTLSIGSVCLLTLLWEIPGVWPDTPWFPLLEPWVCWQGHSGS